MNNYNFLDKLFFLYSVLRGKTPYMCKTVEKPYRWYGSKNGGFYVIPKLLNEKSVVYSFGIGEDISFDKELINKHGCSVYGFDPTPKSIKWVENQKTPDRFHFLPYGISDKTGIVTFYLPKNESHVSGSLAENSNIDTSRKVEVPVKSFNDIIKELKHKRIDVLKMDIEGAEYNVIPDILKQEINIRQILIEFHHRLFSNGNSMTKEAVELLKSYEFELYAISKNGEELSFVKES